MHPLRRRAVRPAWQALDAGGEATTGQQTAARVGVWSEAFAKLAEEQVGADDVFFHKYYSSKVGAMARCVHFATEPVRASCAGIFASLPLLSSPPIRGQRAISREGAEAHHLHTDVVVLTCAGG